MVLPVGLGAPGIYHDRQKAPPSLAASRMDVCALLGVAPRGPARLPVLDERWPHNPRHFRPQRGRRRSVAVAVESLEEYRRLFGGDEGPGRLPHAVACFFRQGGQRAYVVRIVHDCGENDRGNVRGAARGTIPGVTASGDEVALVARNEGNWGNRLHAALGYTMAPLSFEGATGSELLFDGGEKVPAGTLFRLTLEDGLRRFQFAVSVVREPRPDSLGYRLRVGLDGSFAGELQALEVVEGVLWVDDGAGRTERHERLGLSCSHPRWMGLVLYDESELVYPEVSWVQGDVLPDSADTLDEPFLRSSGEPQFTGGEDHYDEITPEDFFDSDWMWGNLEPGAGVFALLNLPDVSSVVVPDLYDPEPLGPIEPPVHLPLAGPEFRPCVDFQAVPTTAEIAPMELSRLRLDPRLPDERRQIVALQQRLVDVADRLRSWVLLLDVPPALSHREILAWRAQFASSYVAAYFPWLRVSRTAERRGQDAGLILLNPSAAAAGIIARQENLFGVAHGPANVLVEGVVDVAESVSPARHGQLHPRGINVYLRERDGVRLTAGRTLARDHRYRQLNVRRLMIMLRRTLQQQTHWIVFEPNTSSLRADVRHTLGNYLRELYQGGAFQGASEEEAFFVRCDEELNPPRIVDAGQLVAQVGVAPSEPIEFVLLRITAGADGMAAVEEE